MSNKQPHRPNPTFRFDIYADGCDDALDIYRTGRKQHLARLRYWTATGLTAPLAELFSKTPGLLPAGKQLLAEMETALASADWRVCNSAEQAATLFVGLWAAIAQAERSAP